MPQPSLRLVSNRTLGAWTIRVGNQPVTTFRGAPTKVSQMSDTDPFGPAAASLEFPAISALEEIGSPWTDTGWLRADQPVEISWVTTNTEVLSMMKFLGWPPHRTWRGHVSEISVSSDKGVEIVCTGALRQLDSILAKPSTPIRPWPYEWAIVRAMRNAAFALGDVNSVGAVKPMDAYTWDDVESWWPVTYTENPKNTWMRPEKLNIGDKWSGMVTRETGQWDATLTSYVANLLANMWTERGRFTIDMEPYSWKPRLRHAYGPGFTDPESVLRIDAAWPGVKFELKSDYSQTANTIYGTVNAEWAGLEFKNEVYTPQGSLAYYKPFAKSSDTSNQVRREIHMPFPAGLTQVQSYQVAAEHISRMSSPGVVGQITLENVDPVIQAQSADAPIGAGEWIQVPKQVLRPGMVVRLDGYRGERPGIELFVVETDFDIDKNSVTLTVDTKARDYMTVNEVLNSGRDSLTVTHLMTVGDYSPMIPDALVPWNSSLDGVGTSGGTEGRPVSGMVPHRSANLWYLWATSDGSPSPFPWYNITKKYPPKRFPESYLKIHGSPLYHRGYTTNIQGTDVEVAATTENFWTSRPQLTGVEYPERDWQSKKGHPFCFLSSAGEAKSIEIMCVDALGEQLAVSYGVYLIQLQYQVTEGGKIRGWLPYPGMAMTPLRRQYKGEGRLYQKDTFYPFAPYMFSNIDERGKFPKYRGGDDDSAQKGKRLIGWGNHWERPGYWPYTMQYDYADTPTGLFKDDTGFSWDFTGTLTAEKTRRLTTVRDYNIAAGVAVMIFCDDAPTVDKYFIGRIYKKEPQ